MSLADEPLYDAIDTALDTGALKLRHALRAVLRRCEIAEEDWETTPHPPARPGAPETLRTPAEAWLPAAGIRNLIARELGVDLGGQS